MALNKYQKLARLMKRHFIDFENYFQEVAVLLNVLQFHFYESYLVIGRSLITEVALKNMMLTHRHALKVFSKDSNVQSTAKNFPLIGFVHSPRFYPLSKTLIKPSEYFEGDKLIVPWNVKIVLPEENIRILEEAKYDAISYCASKNERPEWIDCFQNEEKAATITNQLFAAEKKHLDKLKLEENLKKLALPFFHKAILEFFPGINIEKIQTLLQSDFVPPKNTDLATARQIVNDILLNHKKRHFEDFQQYWRSKITKLAFEGVESDLSVEECFYYDRELKSMGPTSRWITSKALDRQSYGKFIHYFSTRFIDNPLKNSVDGEITLLLWIMFHISYDVEKSTTLEKILKVTTKDILERYLTIDDIEIILPQGLTDLIHEFIGGKKDYRQQKIFPLLTLDKLEDHFHRASKNILGKDSLPALPEAFLSFPHSKKGERIVPSLRRNHLKSPQKIYHDPITLKQLRQQLIEKSPMKLS